MTSGQSISVVATPFPLDIQPKETAVLVVDMQNHFVSPGGTWANAGIDTSPILAVVQPIKRVVNTARNAGSKVVYLTMPVPAAPAPAGIPPEAYGGRGLERWAHYLRGVDAHQPTPVPLDAVGATSPTWNADIVTELAPEAEDIVASKSQLSGFYGTDLDAVLRRFGIRYLVFTGCTTSVCVESTLRDAVFRDYQCLLLADCTAEPVGRGLARSNHEASVLLTELVFGWVADSAALVEALTAPAFTTA